ncbi:MAG TPA: type II toxin-antitoxin system HicB family antitoxin [Burkholderiaceae bacterium]|nr:type II toxin-antitoxin system HicB family antitoxin [Burkholderiaceae bacterium]
MNVMRYRGYSARVELDAEDRIFVGHIAGIRDIVGFHGRSVDELEAAFQEAVDYYLEACAKLKQPPNKPYSGRVMLRIDPETHARASTLAQLAGASFNQWATELIARETARHEQVRHLGDAMAPPSPKRKRPTQSTKKSGIRSFVPGTTA